MGVGVLGLVLLVILRFGLDWFGCLLMLYALYGWVGIAILLDSYVIFVCVA